jgi:ABC-2 type transport system permease protein
MSATSDAVSKADEPGSTFAVSLGATLALARRTFRDARTRTLAFAYIFAAYCYIEPVGYRHTYATLADRLAFAHDFANNKGLRLFYGEPHDLLTVSGYTAWRVGGTLAIFASIYGLLAAVRALRAEEDTGRMELVLVGVIGRRTAFLSAMAAIGAGVCALWLAEFAGFVLGGLPAGGSAYLALATASVVPVCVGVGAIVSQLAPTRRIALELGGAVIGLLFLLRVIADTSSSVGWLRWATPLGWAEQLRPFSGARPAVLLLPAVASVLLLLAAARIAEGRDIGTGLLPARDTAEPRLRLLSSPTAQALRSGRGSLIVWTSSVAVFAFILGVVSQSVSSAGISKSVEREIAKLGSGSILTPSGYLAFVFIFFILTVGLFACAQIGAARNEEADERLETLLALPVSRASWLGGRLLLAGCGAATISLVCGLLTWVGAASVGVSIPLARMLEAGANCLPVALLFLGIAALAYAVVPRASAALAYGLVTVTFLWQLVGSLLGAPKWLVDLTPFAHVGLVPAQPFRAGAAVVMLAIGALSALTAIAVFQRRDVIGA